jgi:hypothetical protein
MEFIMALSYDCSEKTGGKGSEDVRGRVEKRGEEAS